MILYTPTLMSLMLFPKNGISYGILSIMYFGGAFIHIVITKTKVHVLDQCNAM